MSTATEAIYRRILKLPDSERQALLDRLQSDNRGESPFSDDVREQWEAEIAKRVAEMENGTVNTSTWEDLEARLEAREKNAQESA